MPPPETRSGPPGTTRIAARPPDDSTAAKAPEITVRVRHAADQLAMRRGRALPLAFASQAEPCAGRTMWHAMYRCGACGGTHFARSQEELVTGKRLARCGRVIWLVISRTYRAGTDRGAAA
jgi:hypothetical protein